jgi:multicopper oxidase
MWRFEATPRYVAAPDGDATGARGVVAEPSLERCFFNVGRWMAHCHLAEHHESGMMFSFDMSS